MPKTLISLLPPKEQKLLKPTPETIAEEILSAEMQKNIASLCDCMKDNNLKIKWVGKNGWEVALKKMQILRRIRINPLEKNWYVTLHFFPQYNNYLTDENIRHFVWDNLGGTGCDALNTGGAKCSGYMNQAFNMFGKICENQCCNSQIKILNPTGTALEHTKTLILAARDIVTEGLQ
jgi:hypothetical protein